MPATVTLTATRGPLQGQVFVFDERFQDGGRVQADAPGSSLIPGIRSTAGNRCL
jgi:hypothetical protein